jgi:hypothetical protein
MSTAAAPAPMPLSTFTVRSPVAHDWSIVISAASPPPPKP